MITPEQHRTILALAERASLESVDLALRSMRAGKMLDDSAVNAAIDAIDDYLTALTMAKIGHAAGLRMDGSDVSQASAAVAVDEVGDRVAGK